MEDSKHFDEVANRLMEELPKIKDAAKNLLSEQLARQAVAEQRVDANELLPAIQKVLKAIKSVPLLEPTEWGRRNPQEPNESGVDRIEKLVTYKAAFMLWKRAKSAGASPSALLGRSFLVTIWPQVKDEIGKSESPSPALELVVKAFEESLTSTNVLSLVWTTDMKETVALRHKERKDQAEQRLRQQAQEEAERPLVENDEMDTPNGDL